MDQGKDAHYGESLDSSVLVLFKFCLALFVYHKNSGWLESNIHSQNAIKCSYFWSENIPFSDCVVTVYPWTLTKDSPKITGLPMDTLYMAKIKTLKAEMCELVVAFERESNWLENALMERFKKSLDMRSVGGMAMDRLRRSTVRLMLC